MGLNTADRILTVVVTATLTSAAWIVIGSQFVEAKKEEPVEETALPVPTNVETSAPDRHVVGVEQPAPAETSQLMVPVLNVSPDELTDSFSDDRGGGDHLHAAIDIMAPEGTSVVAAAPGTVERLFQSDAGGTTIYVRSPDKRTIYYYAHLKEYAPGLKEDQRVRRGQRLGSVGSSGNADPAAPHLHFAIMRTTPQAEWWEPATSINPYPLLGGKPASTN